MNKYYVYTHTSPDGIVFYIGKGTGNRYLQADFTHRSQAWKAIAKNGFTGEILQDDLTEEAALELEAHLIANPQPIWRLVNSKLPDKVKNIEYSIFKEYFYYDSNSPSGLRWLVTKGTRAKKDSIAGSLSNKGYYRVKLNSVPYQAHRVIWVLHNGNIDPKMVINHIDGNTQNNNISNLQLCTIAENNSRQLQHTSSSTRKNNITGIRGVSRVQIGNNEYYTGYRTYNNITYRKNFSITKYGEDSALSYCLEFLNTIDIEKGGVSK